MVWILDWLRLLRIMPRTERVTPFWQCLQAARELARRLHHGVAHSRVIFAVSGSLSYHRVASRNQRSSSVGGRIDPRHHMHLLALDDAGGHARGENLGDFQHALLDPWASMRAGRFAIRIDAKSACVKSACVVPALRVAVAETGMSGSTMVVSGRIHAKKRDALECAKANTRDAGSRWRSDVAVRLRVVLLAPAGRST
jgi:hypothetical protein